MEITRREDIGTDLRAPLSARGGVDTPGYALVAAVAQGSVVIHYDSAAEQIVGASRATGEQRAEPIWWAARGTYARQANVQPAWLPGLAVTLADYRPLESPLPIAVVRQRRAQVLALRKGLQVAHPGQSLYFPWIPYQDSLRTFQTYLAKFPRAALSILPELEAVVAALEGTPRAGARLFRDDVDEAEREIASAAGRAKPAKRARGQGFLSDTQLKVAVEAHAMNLALAHYSERGTVIDTSRTESFDYEVEIDGAKWHVEVKGTTGLGDEILLTHNEVEHARRYPRVALFVVSNVEVTRSSDGGIETTGGTVRIVQPWKPHDDQLRALAYRCRLPSRG